MVVDPIRLEVIRNALIAGAEEMNISIWRTARSTVVRETLDYSTALFDGKGNSVAQSTRIPVHLNSMSVCLADIVQHHIPLSEWNEGDVILTNDPYCGGQHLPDFVVFQPLFVNGQRVAIAAAIVHHIDVSGGAAGSYFAGAREVYHEGLRIPPLKLVESGKTNQAIVAIVRQNSREPEKIGGDIQAQIASLAVGARSIERLARRYDTTVIAAAMDAILAQSETAMRDTIHSIPDGTYRFEDFVDDDGQQAVDLKVIASVEIHGDSCTVDLSESADQAPGPVNCTLNMARSGVYCALLSVAEGRAMANSGAYRPIEVICRPGSIVNCLEPAPVANRMATGHRIVTTVLGALSDPLPGLIPAAYYGVSYVAALSAPDRFIEGERRVYFEIEVGGWGAHPQGDGANGFSAGFHNLANSPVEMCESLFPVVFTEYGFIEGSGGDGQFRGGLGLAREWRLDADWGSLSGNFERFRHPPYGLKGGKPGSKGRFLHRRGDQVIELPSKISGVELQRGDHVRLETSGGGGWGEPGARAENDRLADEKGGYL
ncbi:methylhydantoinase [Chromatiales bacterium (ex Bugula neritina AB1)]|nr:methylhydantoinase [Chromatiales bacterium (ex Bugula neritina AB1)]